MVRTATPADVPGLAAMLARAFFDDPLHRYALPSDRRRPAQHRRFFAQRLRALVPDGLVFCDDAHAGAALWAPPGRWRTPPGDLLRTRIVTTRVPLFLLGAARVEHRHPREPHLYLAILGVDPEAQGRGLGSRLLAPVLERCDRDRLPAYLESSKERNVPFYARHGFRVTERVRMPLGPPVWLMWRDPR